MPGKSNVIIAAIAGIAIGIGIGMLIAPEKGAKTRKKIKDKIFDIADKLEDGLPTSLDDLKAIFASGKDGAEPETGPRADSPADTPAV
jgi:gas vesicle protein